MKKQLSLTLAAMLALSGAAVAEAADTDLQAQLDAANQKIEELQGLVDKYEPYYTATLAATWGENNIISVDEIMSEYNQMASYYQQYGIDLEAYGLAAGMKQDILNSHVEEAIEVQKAAELGYDKLSEEQEAQLKAETEAEMEEMISSYINYFYPDQEVTEEMTQEATEYWNTNGMSAESVEVTRRAAMIKDNLEASVTEGIEVTEEEIQTAYDELVASNKESYSASPSGFVSDYTNGTTIAWVPEGHRAVKQVLISFDDDQSSRLSDINSTLSSLNSEREAVVNPTETEAADASAEDVDAEATPAPRSLEEIDADIANVNAQLDALYDELMPEANEVVEEFKNGTSIEDLIAEHNDDPGMTNEPTATKGYAVAEGSVNWDPSFVDAAMSIQNVGEISEPTRGSYGLYIVYYMNDITPGEVALDEIHDALKESALITKAGEALNAAKAGWVEEANVTYYPENLGIAADN